jgi:GT2 family glycosyltransferase
MLALPVELAALASIEKESHDAPVHLVTQHLPDDDLRPDVSVIVVVWNALDYAKACVASVLTASSQREFEVIVVDNGSDQDVLTWLSHQRSRDPRFRYLRIPSNSGFARGVNVGARIARGEYLALVNSDVLVTDGWMDGLVDTLEADLSLGIVSPVTNYVGEGMQVDDAACDLGPEDAARYARTISRRDDVLYPPERVAFFCVAIRRELFERLNGLDEGFGYGNFEDEDFCVRAQLHGYRLGVVRRSFVYHHGSKSFDENKLDHGAWMHQNVGRYLDRLTRISASQPTVLPVRYLSHEEPLVSVITRTRDRPSRLAIALNSLAWQTFRRFEVVVVNDGGEDVQGLLDTYRRHLRISYVCNTTAVGRADALNEGFEASRGRFISYLDDDDLVYPFHLATLVEAAELLEGRERFVFSQWNRALVREVGTGTTTVMERLRTSPWEFDRASLLVQNRVPMHTWLHTRGCVDLAEGGFSADYSILHDWDFLLRVTHQLPLVALLRETCEYRIYFDMSNSVSARSRALADLLRIYASHPTTVPSVQLARNREVQALRRQVEGAAALDAAVEKGAVRAENAGRALLAATFGFTSPLRVPSTTGL